MIWDACADQFFLPMQNLKPEKRKINEENDWKEKLSNFPFWYVKLRAKEEKNNLLWQNHKT